ncbi:hypothetical protein Emag_005915 [Eimeria magna]
MGASLLSFLRDASAACGAAAGVSTSSSSSSSRGRSSSSSSRRRRREEGPSSAEDRGLTSDSGVYVHLSGFKSVRVVRFIESLSLQLNSFDLVISHGGAGSLLECLRAGLKVVACVNSSLLNNHQVELSRHLSAKNHCVCVFDLKDLPNKTLEAWRRPFASPSTPAAGASRAQKATQQQQQEQQQQQQQEPLVPLPPANKDIFFRIIWEEVGSYPNIDIPLRQQAEAESLSLASCLDVAWLAAGMEAPAPTLRLSSPLGSGARSLLFAAEGRLLLIGDSRGKACLFNLDARRPLALLSPADAACVSASPVGLPFGAGSLPFSPGSSSSSNSSNSSPVLQLQQLWGGSSSSNSRVVLQQKDSLLSVFDLSNEKFVGSLMTGAVSFCKCACPTNSSSSSSSSSSGGVLGSECVAAPTAELEVAGIFDLRAPFKARGIARAAPPSLSLRLSREGDRNFADKLGTVQALGFPVAAAAAAAGIPLLAAAYEMPFLALWDLRKPREPLTLERLQEALSPPCELAAPGHRIWVGCIEGDLHLSRISKKQNSNNSNSSRSSSSSSSNSSSNSSSSSSSSSIASRTSDCNVSECSNNSKNSSSSSSSSIDGAEFAVGLSPLACVNIFKSDVEPQGISLEGDGGTRALLPVSSSEAFVDFEALRGDNLHLTSMAVRADSLVGACGGSDGLVRLREGKRLRLVGRLEGHFTSVSSAAWCNHTGRLATGDKEGVILLWDVYRDSFNHRNTFQQI